MAKARPSQVVAMYEQKLCEVKELYKKISGKEYSRLFRMIGNHLINISLFSHEF